MIGDILEGKEKSKLVLIKDTVDQSGKPVLLSLICSLAKRVERVHVICWDRNPGHLQSCIPQQYSSRVVCHDGSRDCLGIHDNESLSVTSDLVSYLTSHPGHHSNPAHHTVAVVIDNLSLSLLHRAAPYTCRILANLRDAKISGADVEQVAALLHADLHDNHSLTLLEHLATTIINVMQPKMDQFLMAANILHKRLSGKVVRITEHFNVDEDYRMCDVTELKSVADIQATSEPPQVDPAANLTFNLTLTDQEKVARSQVKLPYTYDTEKQTETLERSVGEGKIFYQPDEADDFDEEDPDDDLDI
ncbi:elongator complex protein 5-like [Mya arenaria]|uniref:elongator complex protein 5-like n=1 Tax=Mya arenaria TaxID=6604 RepID=UPI0022E499AC|nr:elongator complex protein 5-like [Mya arenaria]